MENNDAFVKEFMRQRARVLGYITAVTGDFHLAEDIFQEVSVVAFRKQAEFQPGTNFGAWVRAIARLKLLEAHRTAARAGLPLGDAALDNLEQAAAEADPRWEAEKDALRLCLERVAGPGRALVDRRYRDGLPLLAIARRTGRTAEAVQVALSRVRKALKDCIARRLAGGEA